MSAIILAATTSTLEVILRAGPATTQPNYAFFSRTRVASTQAASWDSPAVGSTNGTTAVTAVAAPSSGERREIVSGSISNVDTVACDAIVRRNDNGTTRIIARAILRAGDTLVYAEGEWGVIKAGGAKMLAEQEIGGRCRFEAPVGSFGGASTTRAMTSGQTLAIYLGRVPFTVETFVLQFRQTVASASVTWAEVAVARGTPGVLAGANLTTLGYTDATSAMTAAAGNRTVTVTVTGARPDDDLWALVGISASTPGTLQTGVADDLGSGSYLSATARPSTMSADTAFAVDTGNTVDCAAERRAAP